jgi:hypothetical protein
LHEQSRSVRILTQDWDGPQQEALLERLAALVRERVAQGATEDETHFIAKQLSGGHAPITWPVYSDPAGRPPPSLLAGLMSQRATQAQHPIENQFSEALGFLIARWPNFAANFAVRCSQENDRQLQASVAAVDVIGARTRLSLPVLHFDGVKRGFVFPDLSIEGSHRTFQILLEVKVDADLHHAVVDGRKLLQPDAYAAAWRRLIDPSPARTRRVCILTRDPLELHGADPMCGAMTWADVAELLERQQEQGVPPELALIASDLRQTIVARIVPAVIDPGEFAYVTEVAGPLLDGIVATLQSGYPGMRGASPLLVAKDFVRRYIRLEVQGQDLQLLARLSPTGGRYNVPGQTATIMLQFMTDTDETLPPELEPISASCGMQAIRDCAGYTGLKRFIALPPALNGEEAAQIGIRLACELVGALRAP